MMTPFVLSPADHRRITAAIKQAEATTAGEIYCVVATSSDSYFFPAAFVVTAALLLASLAVAAGLEFWWFSIRLPVFVLAQIAALALILGVLWRFPRLRIHLVPRRVRYRRAHLNAVNQFVSRNVHRTAGRTGVLLFASLAERYAEVVADAAIDSKVTQETWNGVVATLISHARERRVADGFLAAIDMVGRIFSEHFPAPAANIDELSDELVEIGGPP